MLSKGIKMIITKNIVIAQMKGTKNKVQENLCKNKNKNQNKKHGVREIEDFLKIKMLI